MDRPDMTSIADLQAQAYALWIKYPNANIERYGLAVAEEAGEVCRAILKRALEIRGTHDEWTAEIRKEVGDLVSTILMLAITEGFDLETVVVERMQHLLARSVNHDPVGS